MKKLMVAGVGGLFTVVATGQDLLQCLSPDVVNGLIFRGNENQVQTFTAGLPDSLSGYQPPAGFTLIGTAHREAINYTTVAFRTDMSRPEAYSAFSASFAGDGWAVEEEQRPMPNVFNLAGAPETNSTLCRDGERINLSIRAVDNVRYASVRITPQDRPRGCNEVDPRLSGRMMMEGGVHDHLPTLYFPESTSPANGTQLGGGYSGAGDSTRTSARIESPDSSSQLSAHLESQMIAQGWRRDAGWSGELSSGASWTRAVDDGTTVWGVLDVIDVGDSTYEVALRMLMDF